jgi:hypothetical protein
MIAVQIAEQQTVCSAAHHIIHMWLESAIPSAE